MCVTSIILPTFQLVPDSQSMVSMLVPAEGYPNLIKVKLSVAESSTISDIEMSVCVDKGLYDRLRVLSKEC